MSDQTAVTVMEPTPVPRKDMISYAAAEGELRAQLDGMIAELNLEDTHSIITFGSKSQTQLRNISREMLDGVRNKDTGPAGEVLNEMVLSIRGFDISDLMEEPGFFARLFSKLKPIAKAIQRYESVRSQINSLQRKLEQHKSTLLRDIVMLDKQYEAALAYFDSLALYIAAGKEMLNRLDTEILPEAKRQADASGDAVAAENYRKQVSARDDLERKIHDLELSRQVTMQSLPSIGMVQDNDKSLVTKIDSTIINTIPLWEIQLSQALTIHRSREAAQVVKGVNDLNNEMLKANAANLKKANAEIRKEVERGVFDIEAVKQANDDLIATIQESLQIAEDARNRRRDAEKELVICEEKLREALVQAS